MIRLHRRYSLEFKAGNTKRQTCKMQLDLLCCIQAVFEAPQRGSEDTSLSARRLGSVWAPHLVSVHERSAQHQGSAPAYRQVIHANGACFYHCRGTHDGFWRCCSVLHSVHPFQSDAIFQFVCVTSPMAWLLLWVFVGNAVMSLGMPSSCQNWPLAFQEALSSLGPCQDESLLSGC